MMFRVADLGHARGRSDEFDPTAEGARHGLTPAVSREIWELVCREAAERFASWDEARARSRFHELAARVAAGGVLHPAPGRRTRQGSETEPGRDATEACAVGKTTQVERAESRAARGGASAPEVVSRAEVVADPADAPRSVQAPAPRAPARQPARGSEPTARGSEPTARASEPTAREDPAGARMQRLFGVRRDPWMPDGLAAAPLAAAILPAPRPVMLYRRAASAGGTPDLEVVDAALRQRGGGQPLPEDLRREVEQVLGVSLAAVRVHRDALAARAARALGADAFTVGTDVYFADGAFDPGTRAGRKLIAHELTHVAQALRGSSAQPADGVHISQPGEPAEREADGVADHVDRVAPEPVPIDLAAGEPLPDEVRARFEPAFAADLGHVRIHRGEDAASWAARIGASAATTANHIAFGAGQFAPATPDGDRLIGHELAHVLQRRNGAVAPGMTSPGDAAETEADTAGSRAAAGLSVGPLRAPAAAVARAPAGKPPLIELEVDPTNPNQLVHEPRPEANARWIDRSLTQVGYTIWLFGFAVWVTGQRDPILVPEDHVRFAVAKAIPINRHIYNSHAEATAAVARTATPAGDTTPRYAYYWGAGGLVVVPTLICPATAPLTTETMWQTRVKYAEYVQQELVGLAEMMILGKLLDLAHARAGRVGADEPVARTKPDNPGPVKTEPVKTAKTEPVKTAKTEPVKTDPAKTDPVDAKSGKTAAANGELVKGEPVKTRPVKREPAKDEPTTTEPAKDEPTTTEPAKARPVSGETDATRIGKQVHKANADARRKSGDWDEVNTPMKTEDGEAVEVPKRVNLKTGEPAGAKTQGAQPDAVSYKRGEILDDKPAGRPISKDRQEMIRYIQAYRQRTGELPKKIIIERYDPVTGKHVATETYAPSDFLPAQPGTP